MNNKNLMILSGGLFVMFAMFSGCGERSGEKEYGKAMESWRGGDLVRARTLLEKSIRKSSGNEKKSVAYNQLGVILWQLKETDAAIEAFGKSCNLTEEQTGANVNMGVALLQAGRLDEAEVVLNNVLGDNPKNATALATMGLLEMRRKNWNKASQNVAGALRTQPRDPASQNAQALIELHATGNSDAAISRLKQLLAAYPEYAPPAYNLATIYDQWQNNAVVAQLWYNQYLQKAGENGSHADGAKKAMARLAASGSQNSATTPNKPDPQTAARFIAEGSKLHGAGKFSEAVRQYGLALQADPSQKTAYYNMGLSHYELKQYAEAAQACRNAIKLDSSFADARYMLALSCVQQQNWPEAEREIEALKRVDPTKAAIVQKYLSSVRNR